MKLKSNESEQFKLLDHILPSLPDGAYKAWASQDIVVGEGEGQIRKNFRKEAEFQVVGRAFTLQPDAVFSVYPHENAEGNFSNELPFMVLNLKSLPWQYQMGQQSGVPWVALIVLSGEEGGVEKDISVKELLSGGRDEEIYFPVGKQPEFYVEKPEDICHVVDLPKEVYEKIMPKGEELPYLCHGKYVNLAKTEENVSCKDGYFSVIMGNRFVPSGASQPLKSTVHLCSMLGYGEADLAGCKRVRLCSLYHWSVFSQRSMEAGFGQLISQMDSSEFGDAGADNELRRRGVVAREHRFRTGETSASLYCSPLLPAWAPQFPAVSRHTSDGRMIYDKEKGVFDVRYACAWQLGRMLSLSDEAMALKIHGWRRKMVATMHERQLSWHMAERMPDFEKMARELKNKLGEGSRDPEESDTVVCEPDNKEGKR